MLMMISICCETYLNSFTGQRKQMVYHKLHESTTGMNASDPAVQDAQPARYSAFPINIPDDMGIDIAVRLLGTCRGESSSPKQLRP